MINEAFKPGHFYSVIPNINKDYNNNSTKFLNLNFNEESHKTILNELNNYLIHFDKEFGSIKNIQYTNIEYKNIVEKNQNEFKYTLLNGAFEWMDARLLHYFLQKNKPKKIIEIGSGNSTLLIYNTKQMFNLDLEIICIEPYPSNYLVSLHDKGEITLIKNNLENIDLNIFTTLTENDILFIDSSHVLKLDSDVLYYFTKIFPLINKGVLIHIHDIFFPYDYPLDWLKEGRFWNEQYFLYVFLQYNDKYKIKFCNSYSQFKYSEELEIIQKNTYERVNNIANNVFSGSSIWLTVEK
jgi:predicted O-methyltransferase YrrM